MKKYTVNRSTKYHGDSLFVSDILTIICQKAFKRLIYFKVLLETMNQQNF